MKITFGLSGDLNSDVLYVCFRMPQGSHERHIDLKQLQPNRTVWIEMLKNFAEEFAKDVWEIIFKK